MSLFSKDRPLLIGAAASVAWHLFWFFAVIVVVSPPKPPERRPLKTVWLGSVLDDSIFKTLVEAKPQLSETFYRRVSDFSETPALEPPPRIIERHPSGEAAAASFGRKFSASLRDAMDSSKALPEDKNA